MLVDSERSLIAGREVRARGRSSHHYIGLAVDILSVLSRWTDAAIRIAGAGLPEEARPVQLHVRRA